MRFLALLVLVVLLAGCSRQPPQPDPEPILGAIVLPATDPKLGPHPDLKLSYEDFCRKHFPDEWREYVELQNRIAELEAKAQATRAGGFDARRWDEADKYDGEATMLSLGSREVYRKLAKMVLARKEQMKGWGG